MPEAVPPLPIAPELIKGLANRLYQSIGAKKGELIVIRGPKSSIEVFEAIIELCVRDGANFTLDVTSGNVHAVLINNADEVGIEKIGQEEVSFYKQTKRYFIF